MSWLRAIPILIAMALLLGAPFALRPSEEYGVAGGRKLIIISPHNEQIRFEFTRAFDAWHQSQFGERVEVVWNVPGGTSEIRKMLLSQYTAALEHGNAAPGGNADLVFGGGSYEFNVLKRPITITVDGHERTVRVLQPIDFEDAWLQQTYGEIAIGDGVLYDFERYWFGTALSAFGIVFNRDVLDRLGVPEPQHWSDLCDPRLQGWVVLVNPAQSGSITTAFEAILQHRGWERGWQILRRAAANSRSFTASSSKAPIEVSIGQAAAGICIDFYGRFQSQAIRESGGRRGRDRVGYVDPAGETSIDADPIAMLTGAPQPELAKRFIQFCLSTQGQALWQFRAGATSADGLGPVQFEIRRMPIVRSMYAEHFDRFIDQVNPFEIAQRAAQPDRNMRKFVAPIFAAMAMQNHDLIREAWRAITSHPAYPRDASIVIAEDVDDLTLKRMLELFDAMPDAPGPGGSPRSLRTAAYLQEIIQGWEEESLWPTEANPVQACQDEFTAYFNKNYREIVDLASRP